MRKRRFNPFFGNHLFPHNFTSEAPGEKYSTEINYENVFNYHKYAIAVFFTCQQFFYNFFIVSASFQFGMIILGAFQRVFQNILQAVKNGGRTQTTVIGGGREKPMRRPLSASERVGGMGFSLTGPPT
jgi:hypothetical protein